LSVGLVWPIWSARAHHERCTCPAQIESLSAAVARAEAVFVGEVTEIADPSQSALLLFAARFDTRLYQQAFAARQISLTVSESWKGVETTRVQVWTKPAGGECGYPFAVGNHYLIYAHRIEERWVTNACLRTRAISGATLDLTYLHTLPVLALRPMLAWEWMCLLAAIVLVLSLAGVFFRFRQRRNVLPLRSPSPWIK